MLLPQPVTESEKTLPNEIAYADDVDFIARERIDVTQIQRILKVTTLKLMSIKQNIQYWTEMKTAGKNTKKVGTLIGDIEGCTEKKAIVHRSPSQITERVGERR